MNKVTIVVGIASAAMALVVFVFADGARRWYSGSFFAAIAVVTLVNALRRRSDNDRP